MKKLLMILFLGTTPVLGFATGDHAAGHDAAGGDTTKPMSHDMNGMKGMEGMKGMAGASHNMQETPFGRPGDPAEVIRTIDVTMDDVLRFVPDEIDVKAGETVRFFIKNAGKMPHEMVIGTLDELKEHAEMMRKMPAMKHAAPNMARLGPGQRGAIVWTFDKPGKVDFACLVPGHMEAGMVGKIKVE